MLTTGWGNLYDRCRGQLPAGAVSLAAWVVRREADGVRLGDFAMHGAARYARMTAW